MKARVLWLCLLGGSAGMALGATLEVRTQPGVEVYWEGVLLATTDEEGLLVVEEVPEGPFDLELRKAGFTPHTTTVDVGPGTTRLERELKPVAGSPERAGEPPDARAEAPPGSAPRFRVTPLGWLLLAAGLGLAAYLALRLRRERRPPVAPARSPVRRRPASARRVASGEPSGTFLSELRQRERAMDDLVDVSRQRDDSEGPGDEVVDVAWKEVD